VVDSLFVSMDSEAMARHVLGAKTSICYAAPGIQPSLARAIADVARRNGPELLTICIDFDERVLRMGFGDLEAIKILRDVGIAVRSTPGLRTGLLIVDLDGFIFTPVARYLEADRRVSSAPNAMRMSQDQVREALARLSPAAKGIAMALARSAEERQRIEQQAVEVPSVRVADHDVEVVDQRLKEAPPISFDVARQVRVFEAYLQYVEISLVGTAIQRHRVKIPRSIQMLGASESLDDRLTTTFALIDRESDLSSRPLERELKDIRDHFTKTIGRDQRILLKAHKPLLAQRLNALRTKINGFQNDVTKKLKTHICGATIKVRGQRQSG
jgi:hypothetical protein